MTDRPLAARVGPRANTSAPDGASWLMALVVLATVIPANEKIAVNEVFFAAHGVSPIAWVIVLTATLVIAWLVLAGVFTLLKAWLDPARFDLVASVLTLLMAWFLAGNALARSVLAGAPALGFAAGLAVAAGITLLARRFRMGTVLFVFASVAAAIPLVTTVLGSSQPTTANTLAFDDQAERPSILWVVSDELQYPLAFDAAGEVRPELPNLKALQQQATTYTRAYSAANFTDYAVPSMLAGIADVAGQGAERMQDVRAGIGVVPGLASRYSIVMESPFYNFECDAADCASVGADSDVGAIARYLGFAKDTAAIAGRTTLAAPFSDAFPSLDGKWRDFWSGGDEFGDNAEGNSVKKVISGIEQAQSASPDSPFFAFWHSIRTHAPWVVDREGATIFPARVPVIDGAHMVGSEADQTYTTSDLMSLERRLYANSAVDFDRQLGELIAELKATGAYDSTMIVVTADHGATMTVAQDRRFGDTLDQRWAEVAHVPLLVKAPGQQLPEIVTQPRSTGQIARTVLTAAGATPPSDLVMAADLGSDLESGPVFTTITGGTMTPWVYAGVEGPDPWVADDLTPPDPAYPFAIGMDLALLGQPVPQGWTQITQRSLTALAGESTQQLLVVDRDAAACDRDDTVGLVSADGTVIGSMLWEKETPPGPATRGWAIVPRSDSYAFWCPASTP